MKLLKTHIWIIAIVISFSMVSCEKVVHLDLNTAEAKIVIEGNISSDPGPYMVTITTSGDYYTAEGIMPITGAAVVISDDIGNVDTLTENTEGVYLTNEIEGESNRTYSINVSYNGEKYSGTEYLPHKICIDSLNYELLDDNQSPPSEEEKLLYTVYCYFTDPLETEDYYRFKIRVNGLIFGGNFNYYYLSSDLLFNGQHTTYGLWGIEALPGDTISIELNSIGFNTFEYFRTLNDALNSGGMGSTPYNPITNLNNDALGYFGTYTSDTEQFIVEEFTQ